MLSGFSSIGARKSLNYPLAEEVVSVDPLVAELVLESVHPDNLGPLPPSPMTLWWKGYQTGIVTRPHEGLVIKTYW